MVYLWILVTTMGLYIYKQPFAENSEPGKYPFIGLLASNKEFTFEIGTSSEVLGFRKKI